MIEDVGLEDILILEGISYKETSGKSGQQLNIRECPQCGKDKWKVYANADSGLGNCFSCGDEGKFNTFKFVSWIIRSKGGQGTNQEVGSYLREVRRKLGYRPKEPAKPKVQVVEEIPFELPYSTPLPYEDGKNHRYLDERGISGHYASMFHLRYSSFGYHEYPNEKGETVRQSFSDRIIIPVFDLDGNCVTFQGRDTTGMSEVRYKFAGGLPGTGRYLYNGHTARTLKSKHVLMCEGAFDVIPAQIALDQVPGLEKVVAIGTFGMTLSKVSKATAGADQVGAFARLKREGGLQTVTIMWDGEQEAYERALDAGQELMKLGLAVRIATLPKPPPGALFKSYDPGIAGVQLIAKTFQEAVPLSRISAMRMRMNNPYKSL